jgi:Clp amino terminal domain, pathogenicity island component/ClpX C4-type zinc finger
VFERFTDRARRVVVLAQEEARLLNHNYIGTEHLLLGLIHERDGVGARALASLGVSLAAARARVGEIIGTGGQAPSGHIPFTPRAKKVLELSLREAMQLGHDHIGTEHVLLGIVREGEGVAAHVLVQLGADLSSVRQRVVELLSGAAGEEPTIPAAMPSVGIAPATCAFCGTASPGCGTLFTGQTGVLICERCIASASTQQVRVRGRSGGAFGTALGRTLSIDELAAAHEPTGPPPDDEEAARREIEHAFRNSAERTSDGRGLVNVERGENLGECQGQVQARYGPIASRTEWVVDHVKFLSGEEAVVWTTTTLDGRPVLPDLTHSEDRAVLVDGKWKVSRDTMCARFARAGVMCPPPEA